MILAYGQFTELVPGTKSKLSAAHIKCIKIFYGYYKLYNVYSILMLLGFPSFSTMVLNAGFESKCASCHQQGMQAVKLCSIKVLQFLTGGAG